MRTPQWAGGSLRLFSLLHGPERGREGTELGGDSPLSYLGALVFTPSAAGDTVVCTEPSAVRPQAEVTAGDPHACCLVPKRPTCPAVPARVTMWGCQCRRRGQPACDSGDAAYTRGPLETGGAPGRTSC